MVEDRTSAGEASSEPSPRLSNGATVLRWAVTDILLKDAFPDRQESEGLLRLAVASYGEGDFYLFFCDISWRVLGDLYFDSLTDAISDAEGRFSPPPIRWNDIASSGGDPKE